jgi:hypothetical protein
MMNEEDTNFFVRFIQRNLPILSIIGVFLAVAKYIYGDGTDVNAIQTSVICTIFVIFLLLMFIIDSFSYIFKQTREEFKKPFFEFLKSYPAYIPSIITIFFIVLLTFAISLSTVQKYPSDVPIFIIFIEMCVSFTFAAIIGLYIIFKLDSKIIVGLILIVTLVSLLIFWGFVKIEHQSPSQIFNNNPFWLLLLYYGLSPLIMGLFMVSFAKFIFLPFQERNE